MVIVMPSPSLIGSTYYLRVRVPADLATKARGKLINVPVNGNTVRVVIGQAVKVSLGTTKAAEAKQRFAEAYAAVQAYWSLLRQPSQLLTQKQLLGLAGEVRADFVAAFDEEPGTAKQWLGVLQANARAANRSPLTIANDEDQELLDLEGRFGAITDVALLRRGVVLQQEQRPRLLRLVAGALDDSARINLRKSQGDYSDSGENSRFPAFEKPQTADTSRTNAALTFEQVIKTQDEARSSGKDALPIGARTVSKYQRAAEEFATFRGSDDITTVTAIEVDRWKKAMLSEAKLKNATIKQRIQNLRTIVEWARKQSLGELFPAGNPLAPVELPAFQSVPSSERTYTMNEARTVLTAARKGENAETRWLPWLAAYSGARINELAQLTRGDFFQVGEDWYFKLTTMGGKSLKNRYSERRVPVHPALIAEGILDFVKAHHRDTDRLFRARSQPVISVWLRKTLKIEREELAPNHGWRHLFEDLCLLGGVLDAARNYITGRSTGNSGEGYGKSEAMLPGLAAQMRKVPNLL